MYATMYAIYAYIGGFGGQMIGYIYIYIWQSGYMDGWSLP